MAETVQLISTFDKQIQFFKPDGRGQNKTHTLRYIKLLKRTQQIPKNCFSTMSDQGQTRSTSASLSERNSKLSKEFVDTEDYDSGILSGPLSTFSKPLSLSPPKKEDRPSSVTHIDTCFDSGVIDDQDSLIKSASHMFLDKGHIGLSDKVSNLQVETSKSLNNLDKSDEHGKKSAAVSIAAPHAQEDVSKMCYRQNDDGDT